MAENVLVFLLIFDADNDSLLCSDGCSKNKGKKTLFFLLFVLKYEVLILDR